MPARWAEKPVTNDWANAECRTLPRDQQQLADIDLRSMWASHEAADELAGGERIHDGDTDAL